MRPMSSNGYGVNRNCAVACSVGVRSNVARRVSDRLQIVAA